MTQRMRSYDTVAARRNRLQAVLDPTVAVTHKHWENTHSNSSKVFLDYFDCDVPYSKRPTSKSKILDMSYSEDACHAQGL